MKAMLLAAGLGTRMGALTRDCPKPLLTVAGKPLIVHHLERLVAAGISEIVINLHYLPDQIMALLGDGRAYAANIRYSYEPLLLGTAGGICQALPLLGDDPFLVISSDIYTDFPWTDFLENTFKLADDKDAYIILINNSKYHADFSLQNHAVTAIPRLTYGNIGIYHPRLFRPLSAGIPHELGKLLKEAIQQNRVLGKQYEGFWMNIGTEAELALSQ